MRRAIKNRLKSLTAKFFHLGQRLGWDVLPRHFYSEIPDIRQLKLTTSWRKPYSMIGVRGSEIGEQKAILERMVPPEMSARFASIGVHSAACRDNGEEGYGPIEAECLFAFVSTLKPKRILQIGCGVSTSVCLAAATAANYQTKITCVEPFPTRFLTNAASEGRIELVKQPAQEVDPGIVEMLEPGDLFFVDSTHTLGPSGEVSRLILEYLPRLRDGTYAHFHDIWWPYDYTGNLLDDALFFWHESTLLHGLLTNNSRIRIACSLSMLHHADPAFLKARFPSYTPRGQEHGIATTSGHYPSSVYLHVSPP